VLDVVTFKWSKPGYRTPFTAEHVNTLYSMVARNYPHPFRMTCVTDDPDGIDNRIRCIELWDDFAHLQNPHGDKNPSCFRRLKLWSHWARYAIGPRIVQLDLDMVIVGDMSPLWNRPEDTVLWADNLNRTSPYNGAMQLITPGAHPVYECFKADPASAIARARRAGFFGSDQAQLALWLGPNMPRWTKDDGALSWRVHIRKTPLGQAHLPAAPNCVADLPSGAKIVNFHGIDDPSAVAAFVPWVREHYR
jgi:hypothetical protein